MQWLMSLYIKLVYSVEFIELFKGYKFFFVWEVPAGDVGLKGISFCLSLVETLKIFNFTEGRCAALTWRQSVSRVTAWCL